MNKKNFKRRGCLKKKGRDGRVDVHSDTSAPAVSIKTEQLVIGEIDFAIKYVSREPSFRYTDYIRCVWKQIKRVHLFLEGNCRH